MLVVAWIVFATIVLVLRYAVLPNVGAYRTDLERIASRATGETVRIGSLEASWRGLRPTLVLRALSIVDAHGGEALDLPSVSATLSWESLLVLQVRLAALEIDGPQLALRRDAQGLLYVAGFPIRRKATPDDRAAEWLLAQNAIRVRHARIVWHDELPAEPNDRASSRADLVLSDVDLAIVRSGSRHRIALRATPPAALGAPLDLRAVIEHPFFATRFAEPADWRGELYANVASGDVVAWRAWLPLPATIDAGRGRARVWMRFTQADALAGSFARRLAERTGRPIPPVLDRIGAITADLALDDVAVRWGMTEYSALASIDGRIVASQSPSEQRFAATHMALQPRDGNLVPATDFQIDRSLGASLDDETGKATLGAIDIGVSVGLVPDALIPPLIAQKFAALRPRGILTRTAFEWRGPIAKPKSMKIDAAFEHLAIAAQPPTAEAIAIASRDIVGLDGIARKPHPPFGQPGFDRLGGTMSASIATGADGELTTRATLNLDAADASVTAPGLFDEPVLQFAHLRSEVGIEASGRDVEVRIGHATFDNADLAGAVDLTFRHGPNSGSWNEGTASGKGWLDLDARLSRADVARVPRYLPNLIAPKARSYLSKALVAGRVTDATLRMQGALERLDLRTMPGARTTAYDVGIPDALVAVRDRPAARATVVDPPKTTTDAAVFHAAVKVQGATLLYGPARDPEAALATAGATGQAVVPSIPWPVFEDLDADIVFDQARMTVYGHSARAYGFRLTDVRAELPALADPTHVLRVVGRGSGPAQDLIRFVNTSPVARWTRQFTAATQVSGNARFALALDLPLARPKDAEVAGSVQFAGNDVALNAATPPMRHVDGRLDFTDKGIAIDALTAQALGGPLRIDAATRSDGWIELDARGTIDVATLRAAARDDAAAGPMVPISGVIERVAPFVSGTTAYQVALRVRSKRMADLANDTPDKAPSSVEAVRPDLVIASDLVGLGLSLPAPLDKPAAARWPLRIEIGRTAAAGAAGETQEIHVSLADRIDARIVRQRDPDGRLAVARATYGVGDPSATTGPPTVSVNLPALDLDAWREVVRQVALSPSTPTTAATAQTDNYLPERASLKTPLLRAAGRDFTGVSIDAQRTASGWQGDIAADQVAGRLSYADVSGRTEARNGVAPVSTGRLTARLTRLVIPQAEGTRVTGALDASRQKDFPAIDLVADRFELRGRSLGRLEVLAENVGEGTQREWRLEKLGLTMPEARFAANGAWGHDGSDENTRLDFDIEASDVGALMDRFGLTKTIRNGTARLSGHAAWRGGPSTIDFESMTGSLRLAADKGQFLKADPGIAKLLNILSLQGLPRRLTLDFNDVFAEGFAFYTVRADAVVDRGIASTDDFTMRGVQASVLMSGSADLAKETTDLHVLVLPQINAGAASLGVAVVNPVVGLATFVAQYLFKDSISRALSFEYNVAGPWAKPAVTKIDRNGKVTPVVPRKTASAPAPLPQNE